MSSSNRWNFKKILAASGGCGCRPKPTDIIEPKPKSQATTAAAAAAASLDQRSSHFAASSSADDDGNTSTTFSLNVDSSPQFCPENHNHTQCSKITVSPHPKIHDSLAVVKDSDDPYRDFRQSMLQMILEREIYSGDDLQQLLRCFLQLNSPQHHEVIVRAFMEIWNGAVSAVDDCGPRETPPPCSSSGDT